MQPGERIDNSIMSSTRSTTLSPSMQLSESYISQQCVCKLSVQLLLEHGRWVGRADALSERVGPCKSFEQQVERCDLPWFLGDRCKKVAGSEWEFSLDEVTVECLACASTGRSSSIAMGSELLELTATGDGPTRPKLVGVSRRIRFEADSRSSGCLGFMRTITSTAALSGALMGPSDSKLAQSMGSAAKTAWIRRWHYDFAS